MRLCLSMKVLTCLAVDPQRLNRGGSGADEISHRSRGVHVRLSETERT